MEMGGSGMKRLLKSFNKMSKQRRAVTGFALAAVVLLAGISVKQTLAYFTTYATARGGVPITVGPTTTVREKFKNWQKTIQIENTGDVDCFVRAKVIAGSQFEITAEGSDWTTGDDGYYYYSKVVPVGEMTEPIIASITVGEKVQVSFNVVVVQECTPVTYDEDGNPVAAPDADWSMAAQYEKEEEVE